MVLTSVEQETITNKVYFEYFDKVCTNRMVKALPLLLIAYNEWWEN